MAPSDFYSLNFPSLLSLPAFICIFLLAALFGFFLAPGGLAWALSKARPEAQPIPGPSGFPILGLLLTFTHSLTHRLLAKLSKTFQAEPLMAFSIGLTRFVISSRPDTARELLSSSAFADRPVKESAYELLFHRAMGFAPYGEYWRNLRRISATYLFSPKRISAFGKFRNTIGANMISKIVKAMECDGTVKVRKVLHYGALNNVMMSPITCLSKCRKRPKQGTSKR